MTIKKNNFEFKNKNIETVCNEQPYFSFRITPLPINEGNTTNHENFFKEDNLEFGIVSKSEFIEYIESLSLKGLQSFKFFLQLITEKVKLDIPYAPSYFADNEKYYYKIKISSHNVSTVCMLQSCDFINKLINHYRLGIGQFDLSFSALISQCSEK